LIFKGSEDNEDVRDRIQVSGFPSLLYFADDNKMYKYKDFRNMENITHFIESEGWKTLEGEEIPTEINMSRRYMRMILSPYVVHLV
jgi:Ser-tRNA(Ala) deacylase AlaX